MADNQDLPENKYNTEISTLKIDEAYKDQALTVVRGLVSGNQYDPEAVKLLGFEGEVLQFQAETTLRIATKLSKKTQSGRTKGPVQVANQAAADEGVRKEYLKLSEDRDMTRKIREVVLNRNDKGFAQDGLVVSLPFWRKDFVYYEPCKSCNAKGTILCQRCAGKGMEVCTLCHGSGMAICPQCRGGQQIVGPQGTKIPCPTCHGRGRASCRQCNQTGRVQCRVCRTKGVTTCTTCQGHAWTSQIQIVEIEARASFDYPRDALPEKVAAMVEARRDKISEDAEIHVSQFAPEDPEEEKTQEKVQQTGGGQAIVYSIPIRYEVILPYAHIEYEIAGKSYYTFLFGTKGRLSHVSPFLDDLIKNGARKLSDAAERRGDVAANLQAAAEYRTVKEAIVSAALYPLGKAARKVKALNALGLSNEKIKELVVTADRALKNITDKPRQMGMALSVAGMTALFAAYFLSPLRGMLVGMIANGAFHVAADFLVLGAAVYLSAVVMQMSAGGAMRKALHGIVPPERMRRMTPKLGNKGLWTGLIVVAAFFVMMEIARQTGANAPEWYAGFMARFGV